MSVLVVGMSHRSAPVKVLEQVSMDDVVRDKTAMALVDQPSLSEAMIVSTCNRVEVYAVTNSFHTGVNEVVEVLHRNSGVDLDTLRDHLYVRYADAAAEHMLTVTSGLDSMVVGEQQIIGQVRTAYQRAGELGTVGQALHSLTQVALHTGKRVHTETDIDDAGASMVSFAISRALDLMGLKESEQPLVGKRALVLGAGVMASLAATHLGRLGISELVFSNRTKSRAEVLAERSRDLGIASHAVDFDDRASAIPQVDMVISATGADNFTIEPRHIPRTGMPLMLVDLSMPRDIDDETATIPGVQLVNIERLHEERDTNSNEVQQEARAIVDAELQHYISEQRVRNVVPAVAALRRHAHEIVDVELERLGTRTPTMGDAEREEVEKTVRRVVDKLLHQPTVRVKELAVTSGSVSYETALQELFGLEANRSVDVKAKDLPKANMPKTATNIKETQGEK
ncbi:glutamyl-tRNA reductase [Corynebacterium hindlerae]|uniref:glutamyl-tRNA reductase n=1 Tax=Corynebacterium hindlerae TaxID=699041 RepID=UPI001AD740CE|nr:glutamyl-tRNA reductase [Corynebacterium hindlerae]QTH60140.1 glutamyl-tRNA reductase [Corynebacterium hindlerae]